MLDVSYSLPTNFFFEVELVLCPSFDTEFWLREIAGPFFFFVPYISSMVEARSPVLTAGILPLGCKRSGNCSIDSCVKFSPGAYRDVFSFSFNSGRMTVVI